MPRKPIWSFYDPRKSSSFRASPGPTGGAYSAPPDPLAGLRRRPLRGQEKGGDGKGREERGREETRGEGMGGDGMGGREGTPPRFVADRRPWLMYCCNIIREADTGFN